MHRQVLYLIKHLNREVFEPVMCTSSTNGGLRGEYEHSGCKLYDLKWHRKLDPSTLINLIRVIRIVQPDIIFITEAQNLFYYRLAKIFIIRHVVQIGSFRALTFWLGHLNKFYEVIDNFFVRWLYFSSKYVVVNSIAMKDHYSGLLKIKGKKQLKVIYNGSDFNFPVTRSAESIRQECDIGVNDFMIIMVARLDPWKDFDTLLDVAKIVVNADLRAKFILLGDGELRNILEKKIISMELTESVILLGEKIDVYNYLNASDISVLSTNGEGFSNSIMESMVFAKPVVATNVGGNPEALGDKNKSGFLVPPKSSYLFAEAILSLMRDESLRSITGQSARERIKELCSLRKYISSYEELFLKSLEN